MITKLHKLYIGLEKEEQESCIFHEKKLNKCVTILIVLLSVNLAFRYEYSNYSFDMFSNETWVDMYL